MNKVRAAIYSRVSTDEQADKGTIENQILACREYCKKAGYEVIEEFRDEGVSGTIPLSERSAGARLVAATDMQSVDVAVVYRMDRLSRDVFEGLTARRRLEAKVKLEYTDQRFDGTPDGELQRNLIASIDQHERDNICNRLQTGLRNKVEYRGAYMASQRPYGYVKTDDGKLEPHPEEAPIVEQILQLASEGMSSYAIARQLDAQGTPQPESTTTATTRNHSGWLHRTVRGFLQNPRYYGQAVYGKAKIAMPCPPLIDATLFEKVNAGLSTKKANSKRNTKHDYLLQNLLYCAVCGKRYYADTSHGKRVYCCSVVRSGAKKGADHEGIRTRYSADYLEGAVLDWVCRTVWPLNPDDAFDGFEFEVAEDSESGIPEAAIARLDTELVGLARKRQATIDYAVDGAIDGDDLKASLATLTARKEEVELALTRERKTLQDSVDIAKTASSWIAWVKAHADKDRRVSWTEGEFRESSLEVQRAFVKLMIDRITVEDNDGRGRLRIEGRSSTSIPLYMDQETPSYEIAGVTVGSPLTPRSRTQPMKR